MPGYHDPDLIKIADRALRQVGRRLVKKSGQRCRCPICDDAREDACLVDAKGFKCFACEAAGGRIKFVLATLFNGDESRFDEAAQWLNDEGFPRLDDGLTLQERIALTLETEMAEDLTDPLPGEEQPLTDLDEFRTRIRATRETLVKRYARATLPTYERDLPLDKVCVLAEQGWHFHPCDASSKTPLRGLSWEQITTTDRGRIEQWHGKGHRLGIHLGKSRLIAIDFDIKCFATEGDPDRHWQQAVVAWAAEQADGSIAPSPSGGWHVFFRAPEGKLKRTLIAKRLGLFEHEKDWADARAGRSYVIAYDRPKVDLPPLGAPDELLRAMEAPPSPEPPISFDFSRYIEVPEGRLSHLRPS